MDFIQLNALANIFDSQIDIYRKFKNDLLDYK